MPDTRKESNAEGTSPNAPELKNPDFQSVLKALLAAYQPILRKTTESREESRRTGNRSSAPSSELL